MQTSVPVSDATARHLSCLRILFLDRVWIGLLVVTSLAVPVSLARTFFTGWQPAYAVQFFMLFTLGGGYLIRDMLGYRLRALVIVALLDFNGITSVTSFGLFGASWWWLFMSSLLVALFFHTRTGLYHALGAILLLAVVALLFVQGTLGFDFDANAYNRQWLPWAGMLLGPVLFTLFVFWACDAFLKAVSGTTSNEL
jgi:hypothetical protein